MTDRAPAPADVEALLAEAATKALYETETASGWYGQPECAEVGRIVAKGLLASPALATLRAHERANGFDEALAAVTSGVRSAREAHAERGHRQIVSAFIGLETAIPDTENPYRGGTA